MNAQHYLQLQAAKGFGPVLQRRVLSYLSNKNMTLDEFMSASVSDWQQIGLSSTQASALKNAKDQARMWSDKVAEQEIEVIGWLDNSYPGNLRRVLGDKAPPILYMWGNSTLLHKPSVGFCGARDASEQGIAFAKDTTEQIVMKKWVIVSGHARGIDCTTHKTALENNGSTIIVVPVGLFNFKLRAELKSLASFKSVLILSEFQPNARWSVTNAMTRNRTICGLSNALVIVESGVTGGTFEAGKFALSIKIPLFVADYTHPSQSAQGNLYFIQRGAVPIRRSKKTHRANLSKLFDSVENHQQMLAIAPLPKLVQHSLFS